MHLHFLGTAGYHPNETRHTSCLFIPEVGVMLDAGTGLFRAIPLVQGKKLEVVLSHAHLDHVFGLTYLLDLLAKSPIESIRVYGEAKKIDAVKEHLFAELLFPVIPPIEWIAIDEQTSPLEIGGARVRWFRLEHPGGSAGYRFDWPEVSLAYVTDTTCRPDSDYWHSLAGVDWLVHECNFTDAERSFAELTGHSWTSAVISNAARFKIPRLILTHINPLAIGSDPVALSTNSASHTYGSPNQLIIADDQLVVPLLR